MIDDYWAIFRQGKFDYYFYSLHLVREEFFLKCINGLSVVISTLSLSGWILTGAFEIVWAAIILLSQVLGAIKDHLGMSKKIWALRYYLQDSNSILLSMSEHWRKIKEGLLYDDAELCKLVSDYERRLSQAQERYIDQFVFNELEKIIEKADKKTDAYLSSIHNAKEVISYVRK